MRFAISIVVLCLMSFTCQAQNFSDQYIAANKGKWSLEIPEVQELVHIVMAITPVGIADSNLVDHTTEYYQKVLAHFGKFKDEKIVRWINQELPQRYPYLKMDACGFYFNSEGTIVKDKTYDQLSWTQNSIEVYIPELQQFAIKTSFRKFFKDHALYYEALQLLMKKQLTIDKQWQWLERKFSLRYDNYRITFSPLVYGSHSTNRFEGNNFRQTIMFICGPITHQRYNTNVTEGLMTRVVFTEIDHNYVNPVSERYSDMIYSIFNDRTKWTAGKDSDHYEDAASVFNEYMTWAVFTLYAMDTYPAEDFRIINERTEMQMVNRRGFCHYKAFNAKLMELYRTPDKPPLIPDLYSAILDWCRKQ
jgi:hypothetical protein